MNVLFLHGRAGHRQTTVAKALLGMVPGRLFDNHAARGEVASNMRREIPGSRHARALE